MELLKQILTPTLWFAGLGIFFGIVLAAASKIFAVKVDERVPAISEALPGANCGGCGFSGCAALAEAIVRGDAKINACPVGGNAAATAIGEIMGEESTGTVRMRAQVMCSGTSDFAHRKYIYEGAHDCISAAKMGGGDKCCPNGCVGLGTCVTKCPFGAIKIENGLAVVDYYLCGGCGGCVSSCPKGIIKLIPHDSAHWVGCMSVEKGPVTRKQCDVGCISCRLCEKVCETGAIKVNDYVAAIDYSKCNGCGKCVEKCPRKIIWSSKAQGERGLVIFREDIREPGE